jgi:ABC-type cobalamin/Fe3+-siderophores transport system ATPase subunit
MGEKISNQWVIQLTGLASESHKKKLDNCQGIGSVGLATAFAQSDVWFLDEPTAGLDQNQL